MWYLLGLEMSTGVHGQTASTTAESVALGSVLTGVAVFAEQFLLVLCAICGVQGFVAHTWRTFRKKKCNNFHYIMLQLCCTCCCIKRNGAQNKWNIWKCWSDAKQCKNLNLPHLKHVLWYLYPPATRSSAAYTDLLHLGHFGFSTGLKGILMDVFFFLLKSA